ncbi:unnamed protein product, partial [Closterium sp. NIES-64]
MCRVGHIPLSRGTNPPCSLLCIRILSSPPRTRPTIATSPRFHHAVPSSRLLISFPQTPGDALTGRLCAAGQPHAPRQGAAAQPAPPHGAI